MSGSQMRFSRAFRKPWLVGLNCPNSCGPSRFICPSFCLSPSRPFSIRTWASPMKTQAQGTGSRGYNPSTCCQLNTIFPVWITGPIQAEYSPSTRWHATTSGATWIGCLMQTGYYPSSRCHPKPSPLTRIGCLIQTGYYPSTRCDSNILFLIGTTDPIQAGYYPSTRCHAKTTRAAWIGSLIHDVAVRWSMRRLVGAGDALFRTIIFG